MIERMSYLEALKKRGYSVSITENWGLAITPTPPPDLQRKIDAHVDDIIDEVWATSVDPRPDLVGDTALWVQLLEDAPDELAGHLHGFRCVGARLTKAAAGGYYLERGNEGWWAHQSSFFADYKKYLLPDDSYTGRINALINRALEDLV